MRVEDAFEITECFAYSLKDWKSAEVRRLRYHGQNIVSAAS